MNEQASFTEAGPFEQMVSFEISSRDLDQAMNRASRQISRQVNIPGFRPGRAPRRLVERRVGTQRVRSDALDDLVPVRVGEILSQTEIVPAVPPLLESVTDTDNGAVQLEVRVTTWPRLDSLPDYQGRKIEIRTLPPVSEGVATRLEQLRHMYAPLQTVERAAQDGDFVVIDMTVSEGDRTIDPLALDGFSYEVGSNRLTPEIDQSLVDRQADDEFEIEAPLPEWLTSNTATDDSHDGETADSSEEEQPTLGRYRIRVEEVQSRSLPELDDDWASEYTGHDSLEELRQEIQGELEEERNAIQWENLLAETLKEAVAELEVDLPERLQNAQTELLFRNHLASLENAKMDYGTYLERAGLEHEQFIEALKERAVNGLKARILTESVIDTQALVVEDAEAIEVLRAAFEARDPERFQEEIERGRNIEHIKSDMLQVRAQAFLALQVEPVDDQGELVQIQPPPQIEAWFAPPPPPEETNLGGDITETLYEAEVIDD